MLDQAAERRGLELGPHRIGQLGRHRGVVPGGVVLCQPPMEAAPDSVTTLTQGDTTFSIIGTAHVSARSVAEVREVIEREKPDVVCVELDQQRHDALTQDTAFRNLDIFKVIREGKALYLLAHLALTAYQRRMG